MSSADLSKTVEVTSRDGVGDGEGLAKARALTVSLAEGRWLVAPADRAIMAVEHATAAKMKRQEVTVFFIESSPFFFQN